MQGTDLREAKGLTPEQKAACKAKNAIVDEDVPTSAPSSLPQSKDTQAPSASPAQESTPTPDPDGSNTASQ